MFCPKCGSPVQPNSPTCISCGQPLAWDQPVAAAPQSPMPQQQSYQQPMQYMQQASASGFVPLPASNLRRFCNALIDGVVISIIQSIMAPLLVIASISTAGFFQGYVFGLVIMVLYFSITELVWQKSVGKMITKTKVVLRDGSKPGITTILGRSLARIIPFEAISFLFSNHPVGWHDSLSGTIVVPADQSPDQTRAINYAAAKSSSGSGRTIVIIVAIVLVVILIIGGILSSVVLSSLNVARNKGRDARRVSDLMQLQLSLELYYDAHKGTYPSTLDALVSTAVISAIPVDPQTNASYSYAARGTTSCTGYHLGGVLEDSANSALNIDGDSEPESVCAGSGADFSGADPMLDFTDKK